MAINLSYEVIIVENRHVLSVRALQACANGARNYAL